MKKLWEIPFEFKVSGKVLFGAESAAEAEKLAKEMLMADESNLAESCIFFDPAESGRLVEEEIVGPYLGPVVESERNPEEYGLEEEMEMEDEEDEEG